MHQRNCSTLTPSPLPSSSRQPRSFRRFLPVISTGSFRDSPAPSLSFSLVFFVGFPSCWGRFCLKGEEGGGWGVNTPFFFTFFDFSSFLGFSSLRRSRSVSRRVDLDLWYSRGGLEDFPPQQANVQSVQHTRFSKTEKFTLGFWQFPTICFRKGTQSGTVVGEFHFSDVENFLTQELQCFLSIQYI